MANQSVRAERADGAVELYPLTINCNRYLAREVTIATDFDGADVSGVSYRKQFSGKYAHRIFPGFGHNVPQEDRRGFAQAVIDVDGFS